MKGIVILMNGNSKFYDTRDMSAAIYEIQERLRILYKIGWDIPLVTPDGVFAEGMRRAVSRFQELAGLEVTGIIDYTTWKRIFEESDKALS